MAFTGMATYDNSTTIAEDVANWISIYSQMVTPLLDVIGDSRTPAESVVHSWVEDALWGSSTTINEGATYSNSDLTLTVASSTNFAVNDLIMIDDEILLVATVPNATTLTFAARGYGTSTAATHTDGSTVYKIASGNEEGGDVGTDRAHTRTLRTNYCHVIEPDPVRISREMERSRKLGGIANEREHQLGLLVREALIDLERAVMYSTKGGTPQGASGSPQTMEGLRWWVSSNVTDASSATLTEALLLGYLRSAYTNGAKNVDFIVCNAWQKALIDQFKLSYYRVSNADTGQDIRTDYIRTSFSQTPTRVILNPWARDDELLFGDSSMLSVVPFVPFESKELAQSGFYTRDAIHGSYTLEVHHEEAFGLVKNLATS